eukprot:TRINITY_DN8155_c0_g3_i1.p1 TRINITY_DN8155_c0_g3~~TRINITY_DN8155_c0_g3_i1.p1  ORF type:complete len:187 (-),score=19.39 TRINITY_DN8155_c0_g3_i1:2-538(-)
MEQQINKAGWYIRQENNGWRPISEKILKAYDLIEITTSNKPKVFHYSKHIRQKLTAQQKRKQKLRWLRQMYKDAKMAEEADTQGDSLGEQDKNPFEDSHFEFLDPKEFDDEVNELIEWCEGLDYEKYLDDWKQLATSACSDKFTIQVSDTELGIPDNEPNEDLPLSASASQQHNISPT